MSSVIDRILSLFKGSKKENEPVAEEKHAAAQEEEQSHEFRSEYDEYEQPEEHASEEDQTPARVVWNE